MAMRKNGGAAAALLAAGIGCAAMGILTVLSEASHGVGAWLSWAQPVGALSGKSTLTILIWLAAWAVLGLAWRERQVDLSRTIIWTFVTIAIGFLGTFPPVFSLF